jgi:hypothetical protein
MFTPVILAPFVYVVAENPEGAWKEKGSGYCT